MLFAWLKKNPSKQSKLLLTIVLILHFEGREEGTL